MPTSDDDHLKRATRAAIDLAKHETGEKLQRARRDYHWWHLRHDGDGHSVNETHELICTAMRKAGQPDETLPSFSTVRLVCQRPEPRDPDA